MTQHLNLPNPEAPTPIDVVLRHELHKVRAQREGAHHEEEVAQARRRAGWQHMLEEAGKLQQELQEHARVTHFGISLDRSEITVKVANGAGAHTAYFILTAHHPDDPSFPDFGCIFLRQIGQPDAMFEDPMDGLRELARRIARLLA